MVDSTANGSLELLSRNDHLPSGGAFVQHGTWSAYHVGSRTRPSTQHAIRMLHLNSSASTMAPGPRSQPARISTQQPTATRTLVANSKRKAARRSFGPRRTPGSSTKARSPITNRRSTTYVPGAPQSGGRISHQYRRMRIRPPMAIGTLARPSSNHPGGAVFGFCDGSVRFIGQSRSTIRCTRRLHDFVRPGAHAASAGFAVFSTSSQYYTIQLPALDASQIPSN